MDRSAPFLSKRFDQAAPITEDVAALKFVEAYGEDLRFCHDSGCWFCWDGTRWVKDRTRRAFHFARGLVRELVDLHDDRKRFILSKVSFASGVERFAQADPHVAVTIENWDRDPMLLGTPAGTVDLHTGKLREPRREDGITKATLNAPSDQACPRWLQFLSEATGGGNDLIRFLWQWCGYCLTGSIAEHALMFIYGPGGNGKSVFSNTLCSVLGDYAVTAPMEAFVSSFGDRHPTELAMMRGARLVTATETEENRAWAEARLKQLTGGDQISARFMRQDFFQYRPQFKLMFNGNHQPALHSVDEAARRRINIVPFILKPASPDRNLEKKLIAEASGILNWMIAGCLEWQRDGLVRPETVRAATDDYFADQDLLGQWLADHCDQRGDIWDSSANLFDSWTAYSVKAGEKPGTKKAFGLAMKRQGFQPTRKGARGFLRVRVRPEPLHEGER